MLIRFACWDKYNVVISG